MTVQTPNSLDHRMAKALAHPLRFSILTALNDGVASPSELAEQLGERLPNVAYHVKFLADNGIIELVSTTPRRGTVEHHYRALRRPILTDAEWAALPGPVRQSTTGRLLRQILGEIRDAAAGDGFRRPEHHITRLPLALDEQGFAELGAALVELIDRAFEIQAASAGRLQDSERGGAAVDSTLALVHFERP